MRQIIVKQLDYDFTPVAGMNLVGHYLASIKPIFNKIDAVLFVKGCVAGAEFVRSYVRLLVQARSDFDAIKGYRGDTFNKTSLGICVLPSNSTPRQRMDARAPDLFDFSAQIIELLLASHRPDFGVLLCDWLPSDVDTFALDNGGIIKEIVGRAYASVDG